MEILWVYFNLTAFEQNELQKELDKIELPLSDVNAKANANGATINISGPGQEFEGISLVTDSNIIYDKKSRKIIIFLLFVYNTSLSPSN
jgi:hypothetical protein